MTGKTKAAPKAPETETEPEKAPLFTTLMIPSGTLEEDQQEVIIPIAGKPTYVPRDQWVCLPTPYVIAAQNMTLGETVKRKNFDLKDFDDAGDVPTGTTQTEYDVKDIPRFPGMQVREPTAEELSGALKIWPKGLLLGK